MEYDEIPQHIRQFIPRAYYNRLSSEARQMAIELATAYFNENSDSVRFRAEMTSHPTPRDMFTPNYINEVAGIRRIQYVLTEGHDAPDRHQFVDIIQALVREMHAINVVLHYIDQNDYARWISFAQVDIRRIGLEGCVQGIETGAVNWDPDMYHGSETAYGHILHSTLSLNTFSVIVPVHPEGGSHRKQYINYTTKGIDSEDNDCLIECFKHFKDVIFTNDSIRKILKVRPGKKLGLQHVPKLEEIFEINVKVVEDVVYPKVIKVKSQPKTIMTAKVLHGKGRNCILFYEDHFDVVLKRHHKISDIPDETSEDVHEIDPHHYYFFDYETTYNPVTLELEVYAFCVLKFDHNRQLQDSYVGTDNLVDILKKMHDDDKSYLIGFNNSRFDNFLLIQDMISHDFTINNVLIANNSFLSFTSHGFISRDLCRILCTSLKSACQSFKCEMSKLEFDHATVQHHRNQGTFNTYFAQNKSKIFEYVEMDCKALAELFFKTKDAVTQLSDLKIETYPTIGSLTYNAFKTTIDIKMPIVKDVLIDDFIRSSIIGGRTEVIRGEYTDLSSIDVTSLYPYVMLNNRYPIGFPTLVNEYQNDKIGVYNVTIHSQPIPNIIPHKTEEGRLDWKFKGEIKRVLNSVDIDCLLRYGADITIGKGCYWKTATMNIFNDYFDKLMTEKKRQDMFCKSSDDRYNAALRELCKLQMNALSGKLAQKRYENISVFIQNNKQRNAFENKVDKDSIKYFVGKNYIIAEGHKMKTTVQNPVIWGSLIYSYARTYMYDTVLSQVKVYGMDTDSAFIQHEDIVKLGDIYGDKFGQFKIETQHHNAILVAPKCYVFFMKKDEYKIISKDHESITIETKWGTSDYKKYTIDNNQTFIIKQRFKGVNTFRDKVINKEIKDINEIHDYYFDKHHHLNVDTYKLMLRKSVDILTSSLNKRINGNNKLPLSLMQRFTVKHSKDLV